ncbi:hypothetical protein [Archaeoglobus veneficus]|uniref:Pycsar effector protein domain-containing protein n=1 Tax=Archaeoglobus veneficus (strain DSM 11195 / SNP6) TaxID=693661 RepID=F2KRA1_ARCVS|nr:hypothetical protein [Archaeoglobus veneficus]AEA47835.1 hypothetical protein Arcve_1839 [Archaeoglobus veneficus SNP6]
MEDPDSLIYDLSKWFFDHNWKRKITLDDKADGICRTILLMVAANIAILSIVFKYFNEYFLIFLVFISVSFVLLVIGAYFSILALRVRTLAYLIPDPGKIIKDMYGIKGEYDEIPKDFHIKMEFKELQKHYIKKLIDYSYHNQKIIEEKAEYVKKAQDYVIYNICYILALIIIYIIVLIILSIT